MKAADKVLMDVEGKFWTRQNEMVEELEELDYEVVALCHEYVSVVDLRDDGEVEYILYLGHANSTMWVQKLMDAH